MSLTKKIQREVQQERQKYIEDLEVLVKVFCEVLKLNGYGSKRINRLIGQLNERLPEHLQIEGVRK